MDKYILKSVLVAEIEKRIKECDKLADAAADNNLSNTQQANELLIRQYTSLLHFIDTLETKEVDLEKEIEKELNEEWYGEWVNLEKFKRTAKHFYELGLKVQKGE